MTVNSAPSQMALALQALTLATLSLCRCGVLLTWSNVQIHPAALPRRQHIVKVHVASGLTLAPRHGCLVRLPVRVLQRTEISDQQPHCPSLAWILAGNRTVAHTICAGAGVYDLSQKLTEVWQPQSILQSSSMAHLYLVIDGGVLWFGSTEAYKVVGHITQ